MSSSNQSSKSLNFLPGVNFGTVLAGMLIFPPVAGFLPIRASRLRPWKLPKPIRETLSPLATAVMTVLVNALSISLQDLEVTPVSSAMVRKRSSLFMNYPSDLCFGCFG